MGTNYYIKSKPCGHCGRADPDIHIGKSSGGWVFLLHVIPEAGLTSLDAWVAEWSKPGVEIQNDSGKTISPELMLDVITDREGNQKEYNYETLRRNYAETGPRNLLRLVVDGDHCIGHGEGGEGTWSYMTGVFS